MNKKFIKKFAVGTMAFVMMISSAMPVFAATKYQNSVGSVAEDITNGVKVGQDKTQIKQSEYQDVSDFVAAPGAKTYACEVYGTIAEGEDVIGPDGQPIDGSILVSVPKKVILGKNSQGNAYEGSYKIKVKGNIAGNTIISIIPEATFKMSQVNKKDITVNVNQPKQRFVCADSTLVGDDVVKGVEPQFNELAVTTGTMSTTEATAGSWNGICNFTIQMSTQA